MPVKVFSASVSRTKFPQPIQQQNHVFYKIAFYYSVPEDDLVASSYTFKLIFGSEAASASLEPSLYTGIICVSLNLLGLVCFCDISSTHSGMSFFPKRTK